jgi:glycosyltransferase involved in cell wall biosynthesis
LYTRLVSASARRSAQVLTVSHAAAQDIVAALGIDERRVHAIYHGPNYEVQAEVDSQALAVVTGKYALPERYFLYLGGFDSRKNVRRLLEGYAAYLQRGGDPSVKLVMAGATPQAETGVVTDPRRTVAQLGLQEQVIFCGWVEEEDKPALYALSTAYVFPSLYEGFGMTVVEAMAAGAPVITSRAAG